MLAVCLPQLAHCLHGGFKLPGCRFVCECLCSFSGGSYADLKPSPSPSADSAALQAVLCANDHLHLVQHQLLVFCCTSGLDKEELFLCFYILLSSFAYMLLVLAPHCSRVVGSIPCSLFGFCLFRSASQYWPKQMFYFDTSLKCLAVLYSFPCCVKQFKTLKIL